MVVDDSALAESYRVLRSRLDLSELPPLTRAVTEAVLCATADFDFVTDLMCDEAVLAAGVRAIAAGVPVLADAPMVAAGITDCPVICKAAESLAVRLARTTGITVRRPESGSVSAWRDPARSGWSATRRTRSGRSSAA